MPVIYSYPKGTSIIDSDSVLGTDQSNKNNTVTYTMVDIKDYVLKDLLDGVQFRLPIYGKPKALTNSLLYQDTAAEAGTQILGSTVYLNNGNDIGNLIVAQNITSSDGNIVSTAGNIAAGGSIAAGQIIADPSYRLKVNGASNFTGAIIADSTLSVGGTLTVTGQTTLNGYTLVNNRLYTGGDLVIAGPVYDSNLAIGTSEQVLVSDANGTMSWQFYQSSGLEFQSPWDASEGLPPVPTSEVTLANVGKYWVVSVAGNTNLGGITDWEIGDWAIISKDSANNVFWSKIDNSAAITGTGTNNTLTKWTGPTTLGNSIVSESGTTLTIAGDINSQGAIEGESLTINTGPSTLTGNVTFESPVTFEDDVSISSTVDMNSSTIENLADPTAAQEAATKAYVDAQTSGQITGSGTANKLTYWTGTSAVDAVSDFQVVNSKRLRITSLTSDEGIIEGQGAGGVSWIKFGPNTYTPIGGGAADFDRIVTLGGSGVNSEQNVLTVRTSSESAPGGSSDSYRVNIGTSFQVQPGSTALNGDLYINADVHDTNGSLPSVNDSVLVGDTSGQLTWKSQSDLNVVEGVGTTNTLPLWTDGPNRVLGDSGVSETRDVGGNIANIILSTNQATNPLNVNFGTGGTTSFKQGTTEFIRLTDEVNGFYTSRFRYANKLTVDRNSSSNNPSLDVGDADHTYPAAWFRNGVVISNNPSGVQVDNTSMVIGAGNNDNVSGSDHCLIVGSSNQITSNSDQSVAFGQGNAITSSIDAFAVGNSNTLTSSLRTQALGFNNTITASSSFVAGGGNSITANANIFALGDGHTVTTTGSTEDAYLIGTGNTITGGTGSFAIGSNLDGDTGNHMVVGYRNDKTSYPATDYSLGLGNTKFALAVGSTTTTNSNALLITEGGVDRGGGVAQVPRVLLPTIVGFNYADDTAATAAGIPFGGLYHNAGVLRINLLGNSPGPGPDPSADVCGIEFTTANTSITAVTSGPTIVIATDASDWASKINQGIAAAAYYDYDIANASRGLYYNTYAFAVIQPPTGFRKPNLTDITTLLNSPCSDTSLNPGNKNSLATSAGTGNWDSSTFTNTTNRGNSGLNLRAYGYLSNILSQYGTFIKNELRGGFWYDSNGNNNGLVFGDVTSGIAYINELGIAGTAASRSGFNMRFCKDIP